MNRWSITLALAAAAVSVPACTGIIGDAGEGGINTNTSGLCAVDTPVRRLTKVEYNNAIRDLLGDDTEPANALPAEVTIGGFDNQAAGQSVTDLLAEQQLKIAEKISQRATQDMAKLIPYCTEAEDGASQCGAQFVAEFGGKVFRRPLTEDEKARYTALFELGLNDADYGSFKVGIELVIQAFIQSPQFLYKLEFGLDEPVVGDVVQLTDYELATRLSFLIWNTTPDDTLLTAAAAGQLRTPEQVKAQAERMLEDDKAKDAIVHFHEQWLLLHELDAVSKDDAVYSNYYPGLKALWRQEFELFVTDALLNGDGSLRTLLTANHSYMNKELAEFYGVDAADVPSGEAFEKVMLDPQFRSGVLTMGAIMATLARPDSSSPVKRGKFVREQLMCNIIPPPPNNIVITPPPLDDTLTTREQYEVLQQNKDCAFCHNLMNPVGFAFENYDSVGLWRDQQNGKDIDATGTIISTKDLDGDFDGVPELADKLSGSHQVAQCVAAQWFRFAYGRGISKEDSCTVEQLNEAFFASDLNIRQLLVTLTQTDAFRYRHRVVVGEQGGN